MTEQQDRFVVTASPTVPDANSQGVRSPYVEQHWTPYLGPCAILLARRIDQILSEGQASVAIIVNRWADDLGVSPDDILRARHRLIRYGLATEDKGTLVLDRQWPTVPAAITTPAHRAALLAMVDLENEQVTV